MHRGQAARQMKGIAYLEPKITSKISISSGTYVQSASKQAHRYHYIIIIMSMRMLGPEIIGRAACQYFVEIQAQY